MKLWDILPQLKEGQTINVTYKEKGRQDRFIYEDGSLRRVENRYLMSMHRANLEADYELIHEPNSQTRLKEKYFLTVVGLGDKVLYKAPYDLYPTSEQIKNILDLTTLNGKHDYSLKIDKRYVLEADSELIPQFIPFEEALAELRKGKTICCEYDKKLKYNPHWSGEVVGVTIAPDSPNYMIDTDMILNGKWWVK